MWLISPSIGLHALVIESIRLIEEGVRAPADIDAACKLGLGHPIGPFELLDNTTNSLSRAWTKFSIRPTANLPAAASAAPND
jgi:3-hydroxyacyl-CoA dehydrogenase